MKKEAEPKGQDTRVRIQLDLTPGKIQQLDDLKKTADSSTRAETVKKSIAIHAFLAKIAAEGKDLYISAEDLQTLVEGGPTAYSTTTPALETSKTKDLPIPST